jgi:hypothetical protein
MLVEAQVTVNGSREAVWAAVSDVENTSNILSGVESIEVLERPANGLVGLQWRETRVLFGKPAAVDKWIIEAVDNEHYTTRAEDRGIVYTTTMRLLENRGSTILIGSHGSDAQGFSAKVMSLPMVLFKGVMKKAILQDLYDFKSAIENAGLLT